MFGQGRPDMVGMPLLARLGPCTRTDGFTLVELLVVLVVLGLLSSLLGPAFLNVREVIRRIFCASNQRQLAMAWRNCAEAKNRLPLASPEGKDAWQRNAEFGNTERSITAGAIWPHVQETALYRCPANVYNFYVSYSISARLNGEASAASTISQIADPASTMLFIEEYDNRECNLTSFQIDPANYIWINVVAGNHEGGDNLTFVDGRVEYWKWKDPRTLSFDGGHYAVAPDSVDLDRLGKAYNAW